MDDYRRCPHDAPQGQRFASASSEVFMRAILCLSVAICLIAGVFAEHGGPAEDANSILAAAREALGGDGKLAAVTSFTATGRTRQLRGNNLVPIVFEMWCELPDKYVRKDEIPAQESDPTSSGFSGDTLIQIPPPPVMPQMGGMPGAPGPSAAAGASAGRFAAAPAAASAGRSAAVPAGAPAPAAAPPPDPRKARVTTVKQDFVRLTLGMFATSFSSYPVTFTHIGQAEAPQGKADVLEVKGTGAFALKLFINSQTRLPIMVTWTVPAANAVVTTPGQKPPENLAPGSIVVEAPAPPPATAPKEELAKYAQDIIALRKQALTGRLIEHRLYYADYRDIGNGLKFPFRLRHAVAGDTIEETTFNEFTVNRRIDPKRFVAVK
jgi:hypothetical protein